MQRTSLVTSLDLIKEFNKGMDNPKFLTEKSIRNMESMIENYMASFINNNIEPNDPAAAQKISDEFNAPIDAEGNTIMHYIARNFDSLIDLHTLTGYYANELDSLNIIALNLIMQYGGDLSVPNKTNNETPYSISPELAKYTHDLFPEAIRNLENTQHMLEEKLKRVDILENNQQEFVSKSDIRRTVENYKKRIPILTTLKSKLDTAIKSTSLESRVEISDGKVSSQYMQLTNIKRYKDKLYKRPKRDTISRNKANLLGDFIFEVENTQSNEEKKAIVAKYLQTDLAKHHRHTSKAQNKRETTAINLLKEYQKQLFGYQNEVTPIRNKKDMTRHLIEKTLNDLKKEYAQNPLKQQPYALITVRMDPTKIKLLKLAYLENISIRHGNKPILIRSGDNYYMYGVAKNNKWKLTQLNSNAVSNALTVYQQQLLDMGEPGQIFPSEKFSPSGELTEKWFQTHKSDGQVFKFNSLPKILTDVLADAHDPDTYKNQQSEVLLAAINKIEALHKEERDTHNPENSQKLLDVVEETLASTQKNRKELKPAAFDFLSTLNADLRGLRNELRHEIERQKTLPAELVQQQKQANDDINVNIPESPGGESASLPPDRPLPEVPDLASPPDSTLPELPAEESLETLPSLAEIKDGLENYIELNSPKNDNQRELLTLFSNILGNEDLSDVPAILDRFQQTINEMGDFKKIAAGARKIAEQGTVKVEASSANIGQRNTLFHREQPHEQLKQINELINLCNERKSGNDGHAQFYNDRLKNLTQLKKSVETKGVTHDQIERINKIIKNTHEEIDKRQPQKQNSIKSKM